MKKEKTTLDFETISVFVILSVLTGAFLIGMRLVHFAPSFSSETKTPPAEVRSQVDP